MDQRVRLCQSCSWSAEQGKLFFPYPRSRLRIWSRETGSAAPSRVSLLILHTQAESGAFSRDSHPAFRHGQSTGIMVTHIARVWINRVRLPILLVVSGTGKMNIPLSAFVPDNFVSRDGFGSPVPHQPAHLHTQAESGAYLRDSSRVPRRRPYVHLNRHTPSGQSRVYRVTQLRTDGVHCRGSAGTGPVNLKVVPNEYCFRRSHHGPTHIRISFPYPLLV